MKYLDDPFKKVSYSFRIEENLLNQVKLYANATERKLPETFNYLIKESLKDCNLDNTYLTNEGGILINITYITPAFDEFGNEIENPSMYTIGDTNYLNLENEGFLYEVKQIPNNLDIWHDKGGYYSNKEGILHEGLGVVIVPEIVDNEYFELKGYYIRDCLKYIYFSIDNERFIEVTNISYKEAFRRLKEVGNDDLLYKFKNIYKVISDFTEHFIVKYLTDQDPDYLVYCEALYSELLEYAKVFNDGNIINLNEKRPVLNYTDLETVTNYISPEKDLNTIIEDLQNQIDDKDQIITRYKEIIEDLENNYKDLDKRLKELESKE